MNSDDSVPLFSLGHLVCEKEDSGHALLQVASEEDGEWEQFESLIDSGAARSVCPVSLCKDTAPMSRHNGPNYFRTATGDRVENQGLRKIEGVSESGRGLSLVYNVAQVSTPLDSVSQICDKGNVVVFTQSGGFICGPHGKVAFKRKDDTYVRNTWVRRARKSQPLNKNTSGGPTAMEVDSLVGFPRPGSP